MYVNLSDTLRFANTICWHCVNNGVVHNEVVVFHMAPVIQRIQTGFFVDISVNKIALKV